MTMVKLQVIFLTFMIFRAAGLTSTTRQSFYSIFITAEGELKTQELLHFWEQNLGDELAPKFFNPSAYSYLPVQ